MRNVIAHLVLDDTGQDLIEYALLAAFIGLAGVGLFDLIAANMNASYSSWNSGVNRLWEPGAPSAPP